MTAKTRPADGRGALAQFLFATLTVLGFGIVAVVLCRTVDSPGESTYQEIQTGFICLVLHLISLVTGGYLAGRQASLGYAASGLAVGLLATWTLHGVASGEVSLGVLVTGLPFVFVVLYLPGLAAVAVASWPQARRRQAPKVLTSDIDEPL